MKENIFIVILFWVFLPFSFVALFPVALIFKCTHGYWPDIWDAIKYFYFRAKEE